MTSIAQKMQQKEILLLANIAQEQGVQEHKEKGIKWSSGIWT